MPQTANLIRNYVRDLRAGASDRRPVGELLSGAKNGTRRAA